MASEPTIERVAHHVVDVRSSPTGAVTIAPGPLTSAWRVTLPNGTEWVFRTRERARRFIDVDRRARVHGWLERQWWGERAPNRPSHLEMRVYRWPGQWECVADWAAREQRMVEPCRAFMGCGGSPACHAVRAMGRRVCRGHGRPDARPLQRGGRVMNGRNGRWLTDEQMRDGETACAVLAAHRTVSAPRPDAYMVRKVVWAMRRPYRGWGCLRGQPARGGRVMAAVHLRVDPPDVSEDDYTGIVVSVWNGRPSPAGWPSMGCEASHGRR